MNIKKLFTHQLRFYVNLIRTPGVLFPAVIANGDANGTCPLCKSVHNQSFLCKKFFFLKKIKKTVRLGLEKYSAHLIHCRLCDFAYFNPRPDESFLSKFYSNGAQRGMKSDKDELDTLIGYANTVDMAQVEYFLRSKEIHFSQINGKILEIGCGYSSFIPFVKSLNLDVMANDISNEALSFTERVFDVPTIKSMVQDIPEEWHGQFKMIYSKDSLEHHIDPLSSLQKIYELLTPGGILVLIVPNYHSRSFGIVNTAHKYFSFPQHLNYFSPFSLVQALNKLGMSVSYTTYTSIAEIYYSMGSSIEFGAIKPNAEELDLMNKNDELERIIFLAKK